MATKEQEIEWWVRWFRGLNNPETQRKVAERHMSMLWAERRITHREGVYNPQRGGTHILHTANRMEWEQLDDLLDKVWPKVPSEMPDCQAYEEERQGAIETLISLISEAMKKGSK